MFRHADGLVLLSPAFTMTVSPILHDPTDVTMYPVRHMSSLPNPVKVADVEYTVFPHACLTKLGVDEAGKFQNRSQGLQVK